MTYEDPRAFVPETVLDSFILPNASELPPALAEKLLGQLKRVPEDFEVVEPVPDYPGRPEGLCRKYLTTGPDSDMPGLQTDVELFITGQSGVRTPAVAATLVKTRLTTWSAVDWLATHLSKFLERPIRVRDIQVSGLKDRWAVTAQTVVITGVTMADMASVTRYPWFPGRAGFFLKDVRPTDRRLKQGSHQTNGFNITVRIDGKTAGEIEDNIRLRIELLASMGWCIPNLFYRQRLGRRQNLHVIGRSLVSGDYQSRPGMNPFISAVEAATYRFLMEPSSEEQPAATELRKQMEPLWLYNFREMEAILRRDYKKLNLNVEYNIVRRLADDGRYGGSCEAIMADVELADKYSLWVGAWQAYYWNQALAHEMAAGNPRKVIPLLMDCRESRAYYERTAFGRQALSEMDRAEDSVRKLFLTPRRESDGNGKVREHTPFRRTFARVSGFSWKASDGVLKLSFALPGGSYATNLVGLLVNTNDEDDTEAAPEAVSENA